MDLNEMAAKCDEVIHQGDETALLALINRLQESSDVSEETDYFRHYQLGNLYSVLARLKNEYATDWRTDRFPENMVQAINSFRMSLDLAQNAKSTGISEISTNLANELSHFRRGFESFELWSREFIGTGDASFISALSRGRELFWTSHWLNDPGHKEKFQYEAYRTLNELREKLPETSHPVVHHAFDNDRAIQSLLDHGRKNLDCLANWDNVSDPQYSQEEHRYRSWCRLNRLFANPINLITTSSIADRDILQFPDHVVPVGEGPYLAAAFSSIKREYCFARFLCYEGTHGIHPPYEDQDLFLTDTLDYVRYDGATEKIKNALRICFSVFDSVASLMNQYFEKHDRNPSFRSKWIKEQFKDEENPFIDALYWLSCDLTDLSDKAKPKWEAPNPASSDIRKIRNAIEHGWLRVAEQPSELWNEKSDYAHTINPRELEEQTLSLLKLACAALNYFCMAATYREQGNTSAKAITPKMQIPLVDDDIMRVGSVWPKYLNC